MMSFQVRRWLAPALFTLALGVVAVRPAAAATVYQNDFEGTVGNEWTSTMVDSTPTGHRSFLGRFGAETVTLHLANVPAHSSLTVAFDLYVIGDWRGNAGSGFTNLFTFGVDQTNVRVSSSFSNGQAAQTFPARGLGVSYAAGTGAIERNSLGYTADSVYHVILTFAHSASAVNLQFQGYGDASTDQKSWGLDNVRVDANTGALGKAQVHPSKAKVGAAPFTVTLKNKGHGALHGVVSPLFGPVTVSDGDGAFTLAAGETRSITLVRGSGSATAAATVKGQTLVIATDDPANPRLLVPVR